MIAEIVNFILLAGIIQGGLFIFVTFTMRKKIEKPVVYLNLVVLFLSLNNLQAYLIEKGLIFDNNFLRNFHVPWYFFILPSFYAFTINFLGLADKVKSYFRITTIIFCIELIIWTGLILYFTPGREDIVNTFDHSVELINACYSIYFFYLIIKIIFNPGKFAISELYYQDVLWLRKFVYMGFLVIFLWLSFIAVNLNLDADNNFIKYPLQISSSVLLYYLGYRGFIKFSINQNRLQLRSLIQAQESSRLNNSVYQFGGKQEEKLQEIDRFMKEKKPFLNPLYSLDNLAGDIGISSNYTSQIINQMAGKHFADYINEFRVAEAKKYLKNEEFQDYTVVAIGLECGFNSKSSFYSAFKKYTGETPSSFRNKNL
ncbi:AraC family transcriptional regulator [Robertkochia marina]|uniref:AraC family transcriptional regulator n=1 Tax=Robertkochia marina TaxID=1227945 RepID=A0A4S3M6I4_9FLAO|nr:helix-turn-helix transcriptional regulator [Robertkochia marina]THD69847.1 AraC family transcriptional regulator [Robertkochia marina]TRZ46808.1 AraC family transcriptional regulator [Robertkochia marina]